MTVRLLEVVLAAGQLTDAEDEDVGLIIATESNLAAEPSQACKTKTLIVSLAKDAFELLGDGAERYIAFAEGPAGPSTNRRGWTPFGALGPACREGGSPRGQGMWSRHSPLQ